jgi:signal transduction histidine kinase
MIGTHTDISKEMMLSLELSNLNKSLEEKIALATHDLRVSQKQAKLGSWKLNIPNQTLTWSDETYEIFELDKHSHIANYENFLLCIHPEDREKVNKSYLQSLKSQEEYSIAHRLLMPDGRIKYVKEHCETSFNEEGEGLISIGTIQDVSAEYLANEALRNKDEMLFKQSRLAQMGEMLSMIAHQWRQPLSAMSAKTNTLIFKNKMERYDSDDFEKGLFQIAEYTQHLSEKIDDFRDFFKQDKLQEESTCEEILDSVWEIIFPSFNEHRITLSKGDMCDVLVPMYTNEIRQVVLNILKNAEDALVENKIEYPFVSVTCVLGEYENILLSIEDNAGGIDEVIIETLFDPYVTTKQDKDGTGLGLYMSKIMIEEHGGGILSAQNTLKGSIFSISLPLHSKLTKS